MDRAILDAIQLNLASPFLDIIMPMITYLGELGIFWIALGIGLACTKRYRVYGIAVVAAVLLSAFIGSCVLKLLVARPRPFDPSLASQLLISAPADFSFPSGHTAASFAAATVICLMPLNFSIKILSVVTAALIGFSRMYLYVHFPTDVAAGLVLGVACGLCIGLLAKRLDARYQTSKNKGSSSIPS